MSDVNTNDQVLRRSELGLSRTYVKPESDVEKSIAEIWQLVLNIDLIGAQDDFFEIGGDSLAATVLASQIEGQFKCKFRPSDIIESSTVSKQALFINSQQNQINSPLKAPSYLNLFNHSGTKKPLFVIHGGNGFTMYGRNFLEGLGSDQPVGFLEAPGLDGKGPLLGRIEDFAEYYLDAIRQVAPGGNWQIAANCGGSLIAIEMCLQAENHGEHVSRLMLIDPPNLRIKHLKRRKRRLRSRLLKPIKLLKPVKIGWLKFCQSAPINVIRKFFIQISKHPESDVSAEYDSEQASYTASIEARAERQEVLEERFRQRLKDALPSRMTYNAEVMRQVSHYIHEAILIYELRSWDGEAFILASSNHSSNLGFWKQYLTNLRCRALLNLDHKALFADGIPALSDFLHDAMAPDTEKLFQS